MHVHNVSAVRALSWKAMAQLDILIHIREGDADPLAARIAIAIARRVPAHLYGLGVAALGSVTYTSPEAMSFQAYEADRLFAEQNARRTWWRDYLASRGASGEWLAAQGEPVEAICHAARWCDLVVAERPTLNPDAPTGWGTVSRTVFGASAPVVVVPQTTRISSDRRTRADRLEPKPRSHARRAWCATTVACGRQRARARRRDPRRPRSVHAICRNSICANTSRATASTRRCNASRRKTITAPTSSRRRASRKLDLIVMGAWGHSRIAELVLGGATRHIFQSSELPLLVAH